MNTVDSYYQNSMFDPPLRMVIVGQVSFDEQEPFHVDEERVISFFFRCSLFSILTFTISPCFIACLYLLQPSPYSVLSGFSSWWRSTILPLMGKVPTTPINGTLPFPFIPVFDTIQVINAFLCLSNILAASVLFIYLFILNTN